LSAANGVRDDFSKIWQNSRKLFFGVTI